MPTTNSPKGSAIPVRPTPQMRQQLDELSAAGFGNQTDVIRTAIDRMHQQEIKGMSDTPKYFVPMNSQAARTAERNGQIGKIVGEDTDVWGTLYYLVAFGTSEPEIWYPGDGNIAYTKKEAGVLVRYENRMSKEAAA